MSRKAQYRAVGLLACLCIGWAVARTWAYPVPSLVPKSWQLTFTHATPRAIAVRGLNGQVHWYWYMTYKVVNHTGQDQLFVPDITIASDRGDIVTAGKNVPVDVFQTIKKETGNTLLESPALVVGKLLQGEDFAKESVAIWPALDHHVAHISIFVAGLSGETATVKDPVTGQKVMLVKTLMLNYDTPGQTSSPQFKPVVPAGQQWVMR